MRVKRPAMPRMRTPVATMRPVMAVSAVPVVRPAATVKALHPAMIAHGLKVKAAHALLAKKIPGFTSAPASTRMRAVQQHIRMGTK